MKDFISQLPLQCQGLTIQPRHRVALEHFAVDDDIWVVLLTFMPGDSNKAWRLSKWQYWNLQPKHGTRDRYVRENLPPTIEGKRNPKVYTPSLFE